MVMLQRWSLMEGEWSCYSRWSLMEGEWVSYGCFSLVEGEWLCNRGDHFNGGRNGHVTEVVSLLERE